MKKLDKARSGIGILNAVTEVIEYRIRNNIAGLRVECFIQISENIENDGIKYTNPPTKKEPAKVWPVVKKLNFCTKMFAVSKLYSVPPKNTS